MRSWMALAVALALSSNPLAVRAAGPIDLDGITGLPLKWDNTKTVRYNIESGRLNANVDNAQGGQAVDLAFQAWTGLAGVSLSSGRGTAIGVDVTEGNVGGFLDKTDGITPILFDDTGRITDALLGEGASQVVLGFATPEIVTPGTNIIVEGFACMNGKLMELESPESILNLMIHEIGHMLGLSHSQINGEVILDGNAANNATIPIMYPILRSSSPDNLTLLPTPTLDDEVSMGFLYPSGTYTTRGGNISGRVLEDTVDGIVEFRGANVIVRKIDDPLATAVSWPSGISTRTGGGWESHLLPPGDYSVEVEPIDPGFTGGSAIGTFDPPQFITPEFFSGPDESADPKVDNPKKRETLTLAAGQQMPGVDLKANDPFVSIVPTGDAKVVKQSGTVFETDGAEPSYQFSLFVLDTDSTLSLSLNQSNGQPVDLLVRRDDPVFRTSSGDFRADAGVTGLGASKQLLLSRGTTPALSRGQYFVALVNRGNVSADYELTASFNAPLSAQTLGGGSASGGGCAARRGPAGGGEPIDALLLLAPLFAVLTWRARRCRVWHSRRYASRGAVGDAR